MVSKSIKKLKITVTNIKSVLVRDSKKLSKVKVTGKRLEYNKLQLVKREKKESNLETMKKSSPLSGVSKKVGSAFKSPIDKLINTLLLLGTGILINALPPLVSKLKNAFDGIKERFDQLNSIVNKIGNFITDITDPIKNIFKIFGTKVDTKNNNLESNVGDNQEIVDDVEIGDDQDDISLEGEIDTGEGLINSNQISANTSDASSVLSRLNNVIAPAKSKLKIRDSSLKAIDKKMIKQKEKLIVIQRQIVEVLQS